MTVTYPPSFSPTELTPANVADATARLSLINPSPASPEINITPDATGGDQATLGAAVVNLTAKALQHPEVRTERVKRLRAQVASGSYAVDTTQVAEAMLSDPLTGLEG